MICLSRGSLVIGNTKVWAGGENIIDLTNEELYIPSGLIAMWSGAASLIPLGWLLCNGQNGTPNLQDRFIVGAGSAYNVGSTGGSDSVVLSVNQIPAHSHGHALSVSAISHSHTVNGSTSSVSTVTSAGSGSAVYSSNPGSKFSIVSVLNSAGSSSHSHTFSATTDASSHTHTITGSISNTGGGQSHENRPPYYALCFIMKQ